MRLNAKATGQEPMMSDAVEGDAAPPKKKSKLPILIGLLLALILGGGGFYATYAGLILGADAAPEHAEGIAVMPDIAFVPIDPVVVSLGNPAGNRHLKFTSQLEVETTHAAEVTLLLPRIMDVLNSYLSAVDPATLQGRSAIVRVRAQLLRRIQIVTGDGRVRDLLITEFVLN
jgi:flagellar protein FliL